MDIPNKIDIKSLIPGKIINGIIQKIKNNNIYIYLSQKL
mgnify:CR=1 FL=1